MDPKLRKKLFIRKNMSGILAVLAIALILPLTLVLSQTTTKYQQQAAGVEKQKPNNTQTTPPQDYTLLTKCFDKPNQINPCTPAQHKAADLNNDGVIDGIDYNLLIRQTTNKKAQ
jgi:hypothetical protein